MEVWWRKWPKGSWLPFGLPFFFPTSRAHAAAGGVPGCICWFTQISGLFSLLFILPAFLLPACSPWAEDHWTLLAARLARLLPFVVCTLHTANCDNCDKDGAGQRSNARGGDEDQDGRQARQGVGSPTALPASRPRAKGSMPALPVPDCPLVTRQSVCVPWMLRGQPSKVGFSQWDAQVGQVGQVGQVVGRLWCALDARF